MILALGSRKAVYMYTIDGTTISLIRGDSMSLQFTLSKDDEEYIPFAEDHIRFAMKHSELLPGKTGYKDTEPVLVKDIPYDTMTLKINPEDTKSLDFGSYVYDVQITYANGDVDTFIPPSRFNLLAEVD